MNKCKNIPKVMNDVMWNNLLKELEKYKVENPPVKEITEKEVESLIKNAMKKPNGIAINDHVCPTCKNDRVSKSEKSCWKCGSSL